MQVGDILRKKAARVATVRMNETVGIAAQLMRSSNISALVVKDVVRTEGNTAVGMFTERDVVRAVGDKEQRVALWLYVKGARDFQQRSRVAGGFGARRQVGRDGHRIVVAVDH